MKIAYFAHYFPPAGFAAAINTCEIVSRLIERGHKVLVFCQPTFSKSAGLSEGLGRNWAVNVEVYRSLPTPLPLSVAIPHFVNALKALKHEYDLVITQFHLFHLASFAGFLVKALRGKPWVVKVHDMIPDPSLPYAFHKKMFARLCYKVLINDFRKKANKVLVLTSELRDFLVENGYALNRVAVIPNGVDTELFSPPISKTRFNSGKTILYTGSMTPEDGLDNLIKAFAMLTHVPDLRLVLIGDGSERASLIGLMKKLSLERKVLFYRCIRHQLVAEFVRGAYVTVGPLRLSPVNSYTIPTKILEYFACGKTIVSSRVSEDVLSDGYTGLVVKKATPESVAEKLLILIEDEKFTARLGENARQLVLERFDWQKIGDQLEKEIRDVRPYEHD